MKSFLVGLVGLVVAGCELPMHNVYVEESLRDQATVAIDAWNEALALECPLVGLSVVSDRDSADIVVRMGDAPGDLIGCERDGEVIIDREKAEVEPQVLPAVIAHELGHVLVDDDGWHSKDEADLMFAPVSRHRGPEPTHADVRKACEAWGY